MTVHVLVTRSCVNGEVVPVPDDARGVAVREEPVVDTEAEPAFEIAKVRSTALSIGSSKQLCKQLKWQPKKPPMVGGRIGRQRKLPGCRRRYKS